MLEERIEALCREFGGDATTLLQSVEKGLQRLYELPNGIGVIHGHMSDDMFIPHIAVHKEFWGKAALEGAALTLEKIQEETDCRGFFCFIPEQDKRAISFAKRLGFAPIQTQDVSPYGTCQLLERV